MMRVKASRGITRGWGAVLLLLHLMLFFVLSLPAAAAEEMKNAIPTGDSPSLGPKDAPVTIVKFTDYQ